MVNTKYEKPVPEMVGWLLVGLKKKSISSGFI